MFLEATKLERTFERYCSYTSKDLKPHPVGGLDFKSLLASYLNNKSAQRIYFFNGVK